MNVRKCEKGDFDLVYADMKLQFPPSEMKSKANFLKLLSGDDYECCVLEKDGVAAGYFLAFIIRESSMVLLDHFAILKNRQGEGLGHEALADIVGRYSEFRGVILEIEKPDPLKPDTMRRIKFYKSCGAYKIPMNYLLPSVGGVVPMDIYFMNSKSESGKVSTEEIMASLKLVFGKIHSSFPNAKDVWRILERSYSHF